MEVIHVLKDGSVVTDITGYVVKIQDAAPLYHLLHTLGKKANSQNPKR